MRELRLYLDAGLSALPADRAGKRPSVASWREYQKRLPTAAEADAWAASRADAVCVVCGEASGNLEAIDFDNHGELFVKWADALPQGLFDRLVIERTPSGGFHAAYRCETSVCGNVKLATGMRDGKRTTLIETRGEGGLILCAPSPGYVLKQGDYLHLPVLAEAEREMLLNAAWALDETAEEEQHTAPRAEHAPVSARMPVQDGTSARPGDDYNARGDLRALLMKHGWKPLRATPDGNEHWQRPGKKGDGTSATLKDGTFYVFSSNAAPIEPGKAYSPFAIYSLLEHGGNYAKAASALLAEGYGDAHEQDKPDIDWGGLLAKGNLSVLDAEPPEPERPWRNIATEDVRGALEGTLLGDLADLYGSVTNPPLPLEASLQKAVVTAGCCLTGQATQEELNARHGGGNVVSAMLTGANRARLVIDTAGGQLCNIYAMICANSASGKDIGNLLGKFAHFPNNSALPNGQPGTAADWNIGNAGSAEGLAYALTQKPNGLIQISELANWIDPLHWQHKATSFLTEAFSSGSFSQTFSERGKGSPMRSADFCAPNIIANIQPEVFDAYVSQIDLDTGFLGRFLFARMPEFYGDPRNFDMAGKLTRLQELTKPFLGKRGIVKFEEGYQLGLKSVFYGNCERKLYPSWRRLISEYYPRLCVMLSLTSDPATLGGEVVVTEDTKARAALIVKWYFAQAEKMLFSISPSYGKSKDTERLYKRLFEIVRDADRGDGVRLGTISQNASGTGTNSKQRLDILMELVERRWLRLDGNRYKVDCPPPGWAAPKKRRRRRDDGGLSGEC